ncbi:MAG: PTS sugar transporter subunit IIA [Minicystis sp.]
MGVSEILTPERVSVAGEAEGLVRSKPEAVRRLSALLAHRQTIFTADDVEKVLIERERIQSTGIGSGVAMPHGRVPSLDRFIGAVLLCPSPIAFDAIDSAPVSILFAIIGPPGEAGEHLKWLARISKLLRDEGFRGRLLKARTGRSAFELIAAEDGRTVSP